MYLSSSAAAAPATAAAAAGGDSEDKSSRPDRVAEENARRPSSPPLMSSQRIAREASEAVVLGLPLRRRKAEGEEGGDELPRPGSPTLRPAPRHGGGAAAEAKEGGGEEQAVASPRTPPPRKYPSPDGRLPYGSPSNVLSPMSEHLLRRKKAVQAAAVPPRARTAFTFRNAPAHPDK